MNDLNGLLELAIDDANANAEPPATPKEEKLSKSKRIRLYLKQHPGVRNRDVVSALSHHGVKAADVANVKSQMKRKAEKQAVKSQRAGDAAKASSTSVASESLLDAKIGLDVLDAGVQFIELAGGLAEAQHVLTLIKRIRAT